jgi:hypothetical protein
MSTPFFHFFYIFLIFFVFLDFWGFFHTLQHRKIPLFS